MNLIEEKRNQTKRTIQEEIALISKNLELIAKGIDCQNKVYDEHFKKSDVEIQKLYENVHGNGKKGLLERTGIIENTISVMKWVIGIGFTIISVAIPLLKMIK